MEVEILKVSLNTDTGTYNIQLPEGSSVNETVFAMTAVLKVFIREGHLSSCKDALSMVKKYMTDPQYVELKDEV